MRAVPDALKAYASQYENREEVDRYQSRITFPQSLAEATDHRRLTALVLQALERTTIRRLLRSVPDTQFTADLPCGGGKLLPVLFRRRSLIGIDFSAHMLTHFKRNGGKEMIRANIASLPIKAGAIGLVVCNRFLHRLATEDRIAVLTELRRVSAGWALVYYAVSDAFRSTTRRIEAFLGLTVPAGIHFSTKHAARAEIRQANWTIVAERSVLTGLSGGHVFLLKKT